MIDSHLVVSLIEINLDPDMSHSTEVTRKLVPMAVNSLLRKVHGGEEVEGVEECWESVEVE